MLLVDGVLLGHLHGGEDLVTLGVEQRDFLAGIDAVGSRLVGGQGDRDRPEQAVGHLHAVADAFPVGVGHETRQRREAADTHHDDVAGFTGRDVHLRKGGGTVFFCSERIAFEQQRLEISTAVGLH